MSSPPLSFYVTGGTLQQGSTSYVTRQADADLLQALLQKQFCYVLTSRQMGKSSLMVRATYRLRECGVTVVVIDLTAIGQNLTAEQWYRGLLGRLGEQLGFEEDLIDYWRAHKEVGPLQRWLGALTDVALARVSGPLVVLVDEVDVVRSLPFSTDEFFAAIRECHNRRAWEATMTRLTFGLFGVAAPSDLIQDTRTTPFNIGTRIELHDFTPQEAQPLACGLTAGSLPSLSSLCLLNRVLYWTGGHPYLTQRLCQAVAADAAAEGAGDVDRHAESLFFSDKAREQDDNLLFVRERMLHSEMDRVGLLDRYGNICAGRSVADVTTDPLVTQLHLAGIVGAKAGRLHVRNRIYARVFDLDWVRANMPDAELQRQKTAYRLGMLRAVSLSSVILLIMALMVANSWRASHQANASKQVAEQAKSKAVEERGESKKSEQNYRREKLNSDAKTAVVEQEIKKQKQLETKAMILAAKANKAEEQAKQDRDRAIKSKENTARALKEKVVALKKAEYARVAEKTERQAAEKAVLSEQKTLYSSRAQQAFQAWEAGDTPQLVNLVQDMRPDKNQTDLRGFEWRLLRHQYHSGEIGKLQGHDLEGNKYKYPVWILWAAFSKDGKRLATASTDGTIHLWDYEKRREITSWQAYKSWVTCVAFSPDGKYLASCGLSSSSAGVDLLMRGKSKRLNPTGNKTYGSESSIKIWNLATQKPEAEHPATPGNIFINLIYCKSETNSDTIYATTRGGTVEFWEWQKNICTESQIHSGYVMSVAMSPDGKTLAAGSLDGYINLINVQTRNVFCLPKKHTGEVWRVAFSPDGLLLASSSSDNTIVIWDVASWRVLSTLTDHKKTVAGLAFSNDSKRLASGSFDGTARLWDVSDPKHPAAQAELKGHTSLVGCVAFEPAQNKTLVSASTDGTVRMWSAESRNETNALEDFQHEIYWLAFANQGRELVICHQDALSVWNPFSALFTPKFDVRGGTACATSPDGRLLAAAVNISDINNPQRCIKLWDFASRSVRAEQVTESQVNAIVFSQDGTKIAAAFQNGKLMLWDWKHNHELWRVQAHDEMWHALAFTTDGKTIITGGRDGKDGRVELWDATAPNAVAALQRMRVLGHHQGAVNSLAVSSDGKTLITGSMDTTVTFWNVVERKKIQTLEGHAWIWQVAFAPDSKTAVSGDDDGRVKFWSVAMRKEVGTISKITGRIRALAFSGNGKLLAVGGDGKKVYLYRTEPYNDQ